jgi:hypothetical protein
MRHIHIKKTLPLEEHFSIVAVCDFEVVIGFKKNREALIIRRRRMTRMRETDEKQNL